MAIARTFAIEDEVRKIPSTMKAVVYRGVDDVRLEEVPVPEVGPGEILIRVHTCGICGTDLKKISTGSHSAPRIFGHETAGVVAKVGGGASKFSVGDRVVVFHHIPCMACFYCRRKVYAQCPVYKKVGVTAGYEPAANETAANEPAGYVEPAADGSADLRVIGWLEPLKSTWNQTALLALLIPALILLVVAVV